MKWKIKFMSETSNQYLSWTIPESFQKIPVSPRTKIHMFIVWVFGPG
jgi:hypothetical protein